MEVWVDEVYSSLMNISDGAAKALAVHDLKIALVLLGEALIDIIWSLAPVMHWSVTAKTCLVSLAGLVQDPL